LRPEGQGNGVQIAWVKVWIAVAYVVPSNLCGREGEILGKGRVEKKQVIIDPEESKVFASFIPGGS
jgi:hypothetical protein